MFHLMNQQDRHLHMHAAERKQQHLSPMEASTRPLTSPDVVAPNSRGKPPPHIKDKSINDIKATPKINNLTGFIESPSELSPGFSAQDFPPWKTEAY